MKHLMHKSFTALRVAERADAICAVPHNTTMRKNVKQCRPTSC